MRYTPQVSAVVLGTILFQLAVTAAALDAIGVF
jgi:hypothetical protein